ncbi:Competence protein CoiA-like family, contains a predicted nuclease domain [Salinibacillus kushneri]|uniref:Competence protein CoiA-like family, contains a predicted nuclease domain n=1 Tax=Salinibacillus kushneri TaxID=237682 RepID=A0A1I0IZX3_9BACI|nr:competence protein CoiA family protein [Salinibacillus kushneri]SEU02956.1 Competence protein CoiA-like family, contains a predicted nuclease domain [Salinibacillus kushneri]
MKVFTMLKALRKSGTPVILLNKTKTELKELRKDTFYCPHCKEQVFIRAGDKVSPHYAHFQKSQCSFKNKGEGEYHTKGKIALYQWLISQDIEVEMEYYLPKIHQRPDLLAKWKNRYFAIEFQCAVIPPQIIRERSMGYVNAGIIPLWILGENHLKKRGIHQIKTTHFEALFIQKLTPALEPKILFYNPITNLLSSFSNPYSIKSRVYGLLQSSLLKDLTFEQIFSDSKVLDHQLYEYWLKEKRIFRNLRAQYPSSKDQSFILWLYKRGLHPQYLPAEIHLPLPHHFLIETPTYIWQSKVFLEIINPLSNGKTFTYNQVKQSLHSIQKRKPLASIFLEEDVPIREYLGVLEKLNVISQIKRNTYRKKRDVVFPETIEKAINADQNVLDKLIKLEKNT